MLPDNVRVGSADHMENLPLHRIKSNNCPKCEVPPDALGSWAGYHHARDYAKHECYECETPSLNSEHYDPAHACDPIETECIKTQQNVFQGLMRVSTPDLHKPDMLYIIYLGLFMPMMDWIQGFLKKHARQPPFDDGSKALPIYKGFFVPQKGYRQVMQ